MVLENNLIFSLLLSSIITISYYLFSNNMSIMQSDGNENIDHKNNMMILFGISFICSFILKICISNHKINKTGETLTTHFSRPPF